MAREAPSLAELYEGAVCLLFEHRLAGYTRFVGHAVREIRNRLPSAITGSQSTKQLQYKNRLDAILEQWKKADLGTGGLTPVPMVPGSAGSRPAEVALPAGLAQSISELIAEHEATREKPRDVAEKLFIGLKPENKKFQDAIRPAITQWLDVTDRFMKIAHDNGRKDSAMDDGELVGNFELFETALGAIAQQFFTTTDTLDEILEDANS
jgi:hypothetical protein